MTINICRLVIDITPGSRYGAGEFFIIVCIFEGSMASKSGVMLVKMTSTGLTADGRPTEFFYVKKRNPKRRIEKLALRKFDPRAVFADEADFKAAAGNAEGRKRGLHVAFAEKKMPNPKAN